MVRGSSHRIRNLALLLTWTSAALASPQGQARNFLNVDLRDVAKFDLATLPDSQLIIDSIKKSPTQYFKSAPRKVHGIEITAEPVARTDGSTVYAITLLARTKEEGHVFKKYEVTVTGTPRAVASVINTTTTPLSKTRFSIRVGLIQRKAVIEDAQNGIRLVYPLGVGGFDSERVSDTEYGRATLLTPRYKNAVLSRAHVNPARTEPDYYMGKPFMPLTKSNGVVSGIAFHIIQHPGEAPGGFDLNYMVRGFDSHGCMRMRLKDLNELFTIVMNGGSARLPVNIDYFVDVPEDHPYPLEDTKYQRVVYFSAEENAQIKKDPKLAKHHVGHTVTKLQPDDRYTIHRDKHHLVETDYVNAAPPISLLDEMPLPVPPLLSDGVAKTVFRDSDDRLEAEVERP